MSKKESLTDIVFIPGLACDGFILFSHQVARFRELGHKVTIIDNTKAKTNQELVQQIINEVKEPAHFVGLSAGGYALLELLKVKPEIVNKAVLVSTQARSDDEAKKQTRLKMIDQVERGQYSAVTDQLFHVMAAEQHLDNKQLINDYKKMVDKVGPQGFINQMNQVLTRGKFISFLPEIKQKTLIIIGEDDRMFPPPLSQEMAEGINKGGGQAQLKIIKDCGHLSTMEQPEKVTDTLVEFLSRNIERTQPLIARK